MEIVLGYRIPVLPVPDFRAIVAASMANGLLSSDAAHVAVMEAADIADVATNDHDFLRVGTLRVWMPSQAA
jgi:predicted nucleic acid-binding protein